MVRPRSPDAVETLIAHSRGDERATERLSAMVYDELRRIARALMRRERPDHTLQPTALVHEAYMRLIQLREIDWESRAHFRNMAARMMRRVLRDHAEHRNASKRGGGLRRVSLDEGLALGTSAAIELFELDQAIERLSRISDRSSRVAELRVFGGMNNGEIAHVLNVSERTVVEDWQFARAWLARQVSPGSGRE